ncbi:diacylglycerol/lipid kinase family protein [Sphaerisporangium perillae]|uniref:diacylglycerol/lipid kinase family protein n=1 Tax=Sphaerisporangium perillae TaxID=2935860 RepID=UPI00200D6C68|nr:diacylglycerol kinase family protein [Sphaerisporangium perillae]
MNPSKCDLDRYRADVTAELANLGWDASLWFETTPDDFGVGMTAKALAEKVDLVFASGGDGTVRGCAEALMGTDVPLAILPAGTGNLLARNLGLPGGLADAVRVGVEGETRSIDVGVLDGRPFVVMAGIGLDAVLGLSFAAQLEACRGGGGGPITPDPGPAGTKARTTGDPKEGKRS